MGGGVQRHHLLLDRQRAVERLLEQLDQAVALSSWAWDTLSSSEPKAAKDSSSRNWDRSPLSVPTAFFMALIWAAPPTRDTDWPVSKAGRDARLERVVLEVDLAVGDRDHVGRDVGGDVAGLGLDDRQGRGATRRRSRADSLAARSSCGCAGRTHRPGRPRGPAAGAGAARSAGRPRPAWTGRTLRGRVAASSSAWPHGAAGEGGEVRNGDGSEAAATTTTV